MSGTAIWQGIDYEWRQDPHRLNRMGSVLEFDLEDPAPNTVNPFGGPIKGLCTSSFSPGDFKDKADARTSLSNLADRQMAFVHGEVTLTLFGEVGQRQQKTAAKQVVQLPIQGNVTATPVLRGFDVTCTNPFAGVCTRGFGFELLQPELTATTLSFIPRVFVFPENSPDRRAKQFTYEMTVYYTVVCARSDSARITSASEPVVSAYSGSTSTPRFVPGEITGEPDKFRFGVLGLRGMRFTLDGDNKGTKRDGRYLRRLRSFVSNFQYDQVAGNMAFHMHVLFSNRGLIPTDYHVVHEAWPTLIQHNGVKPVQVLVANLIKAANGPTQSTGFSLAGLPATPGDPRPQISRPPRTRRALAGKLG
jgi:hypothetical protein